MVDYKYNISLAPDLTITRCRWHITPSPISLERPPRYAGEFVYSPIPCRLAFGSVKPFKIVPGNIST